MYRAPLDQHKPPCRYGCRYGCRCGFIPTQLVCIRDPCCKARACRAFAAGRQVVDNACRDVGGVGEGKRQRGGALHDVQAWRVTTHPCRWRCADAHKHTHVYRHHALTGGFNLQSTPHPGPAPGLPLTPWTAGGPTCTASCQPPPACVSSCRPSMPASCSSGSAPGSTYTEASWEAEAAALELPLAALARPEAGHPAGTEELSRGPSKAATLSAECCTDGEGGRGGTSGRCGGMRALARIRLAACACLHTRLRLDPPCTTRQCTLVACLPAWPGLLVPATSHSPLGPPATAGLQHETGHQKRSVGCIAGWFPFRRTAASEATAAGPTVPTARPTCGLQQQAKDSSVVAKP